jgi:hypothetical protein
MRYCLTSVLLVCAVAGYSQSQECPPNIDWSLGNLTHWFAYTGNNAGGNGPGAIKQTYDSTFPAPTGTIGATAIHDYKRSDTFGITMVSSNFNDPFGNFAAIPTINGYTYGTTVRLGSTIVAGVNTVDTAGGYVRGLSYRFTVPPGPATVAYTLTYAYALVMNNGSHPNNQQPLFRITLMTADSVVTCASTEHYLPTQPNGNIDTPQAKEQGFFPSAVGSGLIWAKKWTEISINLAQYRGQEVTLTFETDNCVPGGHFAYSYIAVRNNCAVGVAAPVIMGDSVVCSNMPVSYSITPLQGATYQWVVPPGWSVLGGGTGPGVQVQSGTGAGSIVLNMDYSCFGLQSSLPVTITPPSVAGPVSGGTEVCSGVNSVTLTCAGNEGSVLGWLATTDGVTYTALSDTTTQYTAQNLGTTTTYRTVVQNGPTCAIDTGAASTVVVDSMSVGGSLSPADLQFCVGQNVHSTLLLSGQTGKPLNWLQSPDDVHWSEVIPVDATSSFDLSNMSALTFYRVLVQNGVCPVDSSAAVEVNFVNVAFPQASISPADTLVCYNAPAYLSATITIGTNYAWTNTETLTGVGNDIVAILPYTITPVATAKLTTDYVLSIENAGCPNLLLDTFRVRVLPPILVDAGNDTSVVVGEPLQLNATSNDTTTPGGDGFLWTPATGLSNPAIASPVGGYSMKDTIHYVVTATAADGCTGNGSLLVKVFGTGAGIFVPGAFTPGGVSNTIFRPIAVGITSLSYFEVYDRWGQLVYSTTAFGEGWDGRIGGHLAEAGVYVWMVQGKAYTGQIIARQGTVMLIR